MTDYKEILRLKNLGFSNNEVAASVKWGRNTVSRTLKRAEKQSLTWCEAKKMSAEAVRAKLFPADNEAHPRYRMPDYEKVHREMQKIGVTLSLLWVEYCEECRANGELPYQSTQFNKYYAEHVHKAKATHGRLPRSSTITTYRWISRTTPFPMSTSSRRWMCA